jgi:ABC-type sugar transport system permease subunit
LARGPLADTGRAAAVALDERAVATGRRIPFRGGRDDSRFWIPVFLLPFLVLYVGFTVWPLVATIVYSLFDWDGVQPLTQFIGVDNYTRILGDPLFWSAFRNTLLFAVLNTVIKLPLTLLVAVLLTRRWLLFKRFFRTVFFLPIILPVALSGLIFTYLLNPSNGALNTFLLEHGLLRQPIDLLGHDNTALLAIVLISVWQIFGQYMLYWMAALTQVPEELYEAADLDGANERQKMFHVTLPLIRPVAVIITLLALVNALHVFGIIVTLTAGGPGRATYVVSYFIYSEAFQNAPFRYGYASAAALIFAVLAFVFVSGQGLLARRAERLRQHYGV